ncbi:unnamed protein product [Caenorhabditis angaria]|uniref:Uncharacterized protein n=1 Tax=Caenorhabditis angaria TaxID=860376 RepID=A0A9P1IH85_9PELO|nr:unnamed protein product [Caenorhabditis angaria]
MDQEHYEIPKILKIVNSDRFSKNRTSHLLNREICPDVRKSRVSLKLQHLRLFERGKFKKVASLEQATVGFLRSSRFFVTCEGFDGYREISIYEFNGHFAVLKSKIHQNILEKLEIFDNFSETLLFWSPKLDRNFKEESLNFRVSPTIFYIPWNLQIDVDVSSVLYNRRTENLKSLLHPIKNGFIFSTCETILCVKISSKTPRKIDKNYQNFSKQEQIIWTNESPGKPFFENFENSQKIRRFLMETSNKERIIFTKNRKIPENLAIFVTKNALDLENLINYFVPKALANSGISAKLLGICDYEGDVLEVSVVDSVVKILVLTVCEVKVVTKLEEKENEVRNLFYVFKILAEWNAETGKISVKSVQNVKTVKPNEATNPAKWYPLKKFPENPGSRPDFLAQKSEDDTPFLRVFQREDQEIMIVE